MTGITRLRASRVVSSYFRTGERFMGTAYDIYEVDDRIGRKWLFMRDSSIRAQKKNNGRTIAANADYAVEMVTPVLKYADIPMLQEIIRKLRKVGAFINDSCGIHVHIGVKDIFTAKQLRYLANILYSKQNLMFMALAVKDNRLPYCKKISEDLIKRLNEKNPADINDLADLWYSDYSGEDRYRRYHRSRYCCLNFHGLLSRRLPTVELRLFNSSLHAGVVKSYIQLSLLIFCYAFNAKSASAKVTVPSGSYKYAFRVFLLNLGMIGERFSSARLHLLKYLQGNTAWRDRD